MWAQRKLGNCVGWHGRFLLDVILHPIGALLLKEKEVTAYPMEAREQLAGGGE